MVKITQEDKKNAANIWVIVKRQAYGGNLLYAENMIARAMAEERERCAQRLERLCSSTWSDGEPCRLRKGTCDVCALAAEFRGEEVNAS